MAKSSCSHTSGDGLKEVVDVDIKQQWSQERSRGPFLRLCSLLCCPSLVLSTKFSAVSDQLNNEVHHMSICQHAASRGAVG